MAIENVWARVDHINGVVSSRGAQAPDNLLAYLDTISPDEPTRKGIDKQEKELLDEILSSKKRLQAAQRLITKISLAAELPTLLSYFDPAMSSNLLSRIPELSFRLETMVRLVERLEQKQVVNRADLMAFLVNAGQFKSVADHISRRTRNELETLDSDAKDTLKNLGQTFRKKNGSFQGAAGAIGMSLQTSPNSKKNNFTKL